MSKNDGNYRVGYGRPPQEHKWKKGQSGNPRRSKALRPKSLKVLVDEFLADSIWVTENGKRRRCTRFEAIFLQIEVKAMAGRKNAMRALLEYAEFSMENADHRRVIFEYSPEYARVLAARAQMGAAK